MRIEVHARGAAPAPAVDLAATCPPLMRLSPTGELVLIELQGTLEMVGESTDRDTLGTLSFPAGREGQPVLQIAHHRLEGHFVQLRKPLAVLEKRVFPVDGAPVPPPSSPPALPSSPVSPPHSPSVAAGHKRARLEPPVTPERAPRFSDGAFDFSSPGAETRLQTATAYDIVAIVRHKLLFSQRPEPVVRLG